MGMILGSHQNRKIGRFLLAWQSVDSAPIRRDSLADIPSLVTVLEFLIVVNTEVQDWVRVSRADGEAVFEFISDISASLGASIC